MEVSDKIKNGVFTFLRNDLTISQVSKKLNLDKNEEELVYKVLLKNGYKASKGLKSNYVIRLKKAIDEYLNTQTPSLTKIGTKYNLDRHVISRRLKELGYEVINHQNKLKFDNTVFDSIDTEEKAYWLGFIFADGYISSQNSDEKSYYKFELSLKNSDKEHLEKFNKFMKHEDANHVKSGKVMCGETECERCRWSINDRHLWETLNSYGCTPKKSLTLQFPQLNIFKDSSLIKHFIRGYWDGDGCISYRDKEHLIPHISILGTEHFLNGIKDNVLELKNRSLQYNNPDNPNTLVLGAERDPAFKVLYYLYENSSIYLNRKYERYLYFCRLYKKLYKQLQSNIGEGCDANPEITTETKEAVVS